MAEAGKQKNPSGHSGNTYWYDIPKSEWKDHVGDTIHWKVIATDDDNDRSGDMETGSKTGPDIQLKDVTPPQTTITDGPTGTIDYSDVTFKWTGSDTMTSTSNLVYSYKLDGYDTSWSSWTSNTSKPYNDLPNKDYTFKVKAKDEAGNEDPTPAERSFRVDVTSSRSYTFQTTNNAMQITVDGTIYNSPCTVEWDDGTTHNVNVPPEQAIITGQSKYVFTHWSGKSSSTSTSLQITAGSTTAGTYTANYKTQYYLTVNTEPAGITSISGSGWYDAGSTATTGIAPDNVDGYEFSTWKVDGNPVSGNPISVTMNDAHTATACYVSIEKPDLTLSPGDITFSNPNPTEGAIVKITATIHNIGNKDAKSANVKFYDGNPDDGGTQIGVTQSISDIPPSETKDAAVNWDTTGKAGEHTIYVVIADCSPEEASTENNEANRDIFIRRYGVDLSCANPEKSIPSGGYVTYNITVKNTGNVEDTIKFEMPPPPPPRPPTWTYSLDKCSIELSPSESTEVVLTVSDISDKGLPAGSSCEVEVTGISQGDPTKSDSVLTKTTIKGNQPPIANFTYYPENPVVNQPVTFNASSSYDPDGGEITEYWWNVSGTVYTTQKFNHTFTNPGVKYVFLQVKDDEEDTNSTVKWIKVGPENWYAKDSYVKLISGTLAGQDINSSNPEITVSPDKQISGSFDISVKNTGHSGSIFPIVATPNWGSHESSYWSITGHQAPGIKTHTVNVVLTAPSKPGVYYIIVAGQWELSAANVASGTNWRVEENHWNDGNDLADWSTTKIEEAINSGLVIADWEKVEGMIKMYVPATAIRVKVVTEKPKAWLHSGYDLFNTRYYPHPSETAVPMNNFNLSWTSPNKGKILTGDINDDGNLELVSASEERVCALDKDGNELWSRNVATDSSISGAKVNSMDLADMDGDNVPEVILGVSPAVPYPGVNKPLRILFYDGSGNLLKIISTPDSHRINVKCADLDGDGTKEVIATINAWYTLKPRGVYVYDYTTGNELWHYNVGPQIWIDAIADINNDGYKEIILGSFAPHNGNSDHGTDDSHSYVFCFDKDGNNLWTKQIGWDSVSSSVADLDGDGKAEIISFRNQNEPYYPGPNDVYILNPANGNILKTYNGPSNKGWKGWGIADINGDGKKEIVVGNRDGKLRVLDHNLNLINSSSISGTVQAINDINGDGKEAIIVCTDNKRILVLDTDLSRRLDYELDANGNAIVSDLIPGGTNEIIASADKLYVLSGVGENQPPIANFTYYPEKPVVNQPVTFNASSSYDPDGGKITEYWWNVSGTVYTTQKFNHTFTDPGEKYVFLQVKDDEGDTNSTVKWINVAPPNLSVIFEDDFSELNLNTWIPFGSPSPRVLPSAEGRDGVFDNNGDGWCNSGAVSKENFSFPNGFTVESDMFLRVTDVTGCWNDAIIGITRQNTPTGEGVCPTESYPLGVYTGIFYTGDACWATPVEKRRHAYFRAALYAEDGTSESVGYNLSADDYINGWHNYKIVVRSNRYVKFYVDGDLIYASKKKLHPDVLNKKKIFLGVRSSGSAGKSYHDFIKVYAVEKEQQPPIANFTYTPEKPVVNQTITFNASSSYDPDGFIANYKWDFGDGNTATGKIVTHSYSSEGEYTVKLTVTDDSSLTNSTTRKIKVSKEGIPNIAWNMTITATNQLEPVVVGMHPNATDGYDADFDAFAQTPVQGKVILILDGIYSTSIKKTRRYDESVSWNLLVGVPTGETATLSWNAPPNVNLTITEGSNILYPGVELSEGSHELLVTAKLIESTTFSLKLEPGWNMVSLPLVPDNSSVYAVFGSIPTLDTMPVVTWEAPSFVVVEEIEPKIGYWVFTPAETTINVTGKPITNTTLILEAGWNMVGTVGIDNLTISDIPNQVPQRPAVTWVAPSFVKTDVIEPGKSAWVFVTTDTIVTMGKAASGEMKVKAVPTITKIKSVITPATTEEWNLTIFATNQLEPVTLGIHPDATNDYDEEYDVFAQTPVQGKVIMILDKIYATEINRDKLTWNLSVGVPAGQNTTLTWDSLKIPADVSLTLDGIDMKLQNSMELGEGAHSFVIRGSIGELTGGFDTGKPANPYPSIFGTHKGTIKPNKTIIAEKLYTYPCAGTGGHTEYALICNSTWCASAKWEGYKGDWKNITFNTTVVLMPYETYDFTIITGSYPQIHHRKTLPTENGWINCTSFVDANGKVYYDRIPAIRLG